MRRWRRILGGLSLVTLALCALAGGVLGLGGFTFWYAEGGSYFSNNPNACANCHVMREPLDSWQKSSHHAVATCNDCHTPHDFVGKYASKAQNGFWHSKGFTLQDFPEPIRITPRNAKALQANCVACHEGLTHDIVTEGPGGDAANSCVRCHPSVGHGPPR